MWWSEHAIMGGCAALLSVYLAVKGRWAHIGEVALSQFPFWAAFMSLLVLGLSVPAETNAATNVIAAGAFAQWAEVRQARGRRGIVQIYLCVLFLGLASLDAMYVLTPFSVYVILQEIGHYLALIVIWGRAYVERMHGGANTRVHSTDNDTSGGVA